MKTFYLKILNIKKYFLFSNFKAKVSTEYCFFFKWLRKNCLIIYKTVVGNVLGVFFFKESTDWYADLKKTNK